MAGSSGGSGGLAAAVVRYRAWIAGGWIAAGVVLLPAAGRVERTLDVAARIPGSESAAVEEALARRFVSPFARIAVLVVTGVPAPDAPDGRAALEHLVTRLRAIPGVTRCFSYLDAQDTLFRARAADGTFVLCGLDSRRGPADALIPGLRTATTAIAAGLAPEHPGIALRWTGEAALNFDLRRTSSAQAQQAERRALPLTLALLVWAFGAVAAAVLPTVAGMLAIALSLGAAVLISSRWPLSILLQNVVTMLGLGLGIDYALLMVSRFREARAAGAGPVEAAEAAACQAGHTVALSGAAVAIGFAALLLVPLNELRSVAVGGLLVVTASVLLATTLLPGLLVWLGPRVDLGRVRRPVGSAGGRWQRWGRWVARRPGTVLVAAGAPVLLLAVQATRLDTGLPRGDWLPPAMESARAVHDLQAMGRSGVIQTVRVILELPDGVTAGSRAGWEATRHLSDALATDARVAGVRSLPVLAGARWRPSATAFVRQDVRRTFISDDRRAALLEVLPHERVAASELARLVGELRGRDPVTLTGLPGTTLKIGGLPAFNADYEAAVGGRFAGVVALVVAGTLVALLAGFRSVLVAVKAVLLNLLSVAAAFGAVVLVFQDGFGAGLLGLERPLSGVFPVVPILVFCTVFGLSMDYEVFLVARVAEARRAGRDETEALAEGLARTGGVITSAAIIMIAVFAAFMLGDFLLIKVLGFALAVAVLLDATVVRLAIGPALLRVAGRWNWWPGHGVREPRPRLATRAAVHVA
ncbi:MAG: MMPL family transporter [Gemmatimonadales bacterium]